MFTGIIEEIGKIRNITKNNIEISASTVLNETKIGDSISVNGVCLTVTHIANQTFTADISPETRRVTTFNEVKIGDFVNLERAMQLNGRFGGHIVTGHTDGKGKVLSVTNIGEFYELTIGVDSEQSKYIVKKGAITVNGISLTVADIDGNCLKCAIIPHTFENTNLKYLKTGCFVNIEVDILAKHVEKFLSTSDNKSRIDENFLIENGYL